MQNNTKTFTIQGVDILNMCQSMIPDGSIIKKETQSATIVTKDKTYSVHVVKEKNKTAIFINN